MKTKHIVSGTVVVAGIIALGAIAIAQSNLKTHLAPEPASVSATSAVDDLDSATNGDGALAPLKDEERAWLHQMIDEGKIRLATHADKDAWLKVAQSKKPGQKLRMMDGGRTFVILKHLKLPHTLPSGAPFSGDIVFIVADGAPFPQVNGGSGIYDIRCGGKYQAGSWDDGEKQGTGSWPLSQPKPDASQ